MRSPARNWPTCPSVELTYSTVRGPIRFAAEPVPEGHRVSLFLPEGCEGELLLALDGPTDLEELQPPTADGLRRLRLKAGTTNRFLAPRSKPATAPTRDILTALVLRAVQSSIACVLSAAAAIVDAAKPPHA